jgi:hypothetical protein
MAMLGAKSLGDPPGILLADILQALVLQPFTAVLDMEHPHCPILAASEGFSRATTSPTPEFYLADASKKPPLFFPAGELLSKSVASKTGDLVYRAIFLPEICSPPLGFRWPRDIGLGAFVKSLELLAQVYTPLLLTIEPLLDTWFSCINTNPMEFAIPTWCSYASLETTAAFPALIDGIYPPTIINQRGFLSPLMDMRYGLAW